MICIMIGTGCVRTIPRVEPALRYATSSSPFPLQSAKIHQLRGIQGVRGIIPSAKSVNEYYFVSGCLLGYSLASPYGEDRASCAMAA